MSHRMTFQTFESYYKTNYFGFVRAGVAQLHLRMPTCRSRHALAVLLLSAFTACSSSEALPPVELHPALPFVSTALVRLQAPGQPWALFWGSIPTDEKANVCGYGGVNFTQPTVVHYDSVTRALVRHYSQMISKRVQDAHTQAHLGQALLQGQDRPGRWTTDDGSCCRVSTKNNVCSTMLSLPDHTMRSTSR